MLKYKTIVFFTLVCFQISCDLTPKPEKTISLTDNNVFSVSLSEHYALLGTREGYAELWNIKGKTNLVHQWKHTDEDSGIIASAISVTEEYAITAEKNSIAWWRIEDGILLAVWSLPDINSLSISPDGQFALIGLSNKAIYLALEYGKTLYSFAHSDNVSATDISNSGLYALTGSDDHTAKLWDLSTGQLKHNWLHKNKLSVVALSHNDKYAVTNAALSQTQLWKISTGKLHKSIGPKLLTLSSAEFSDSNKFLLIGHTSQRIERWRVKSGKLVKYWRAKKEAFWHPTVATILALKFTSKDKKYYSFASNGYLQKWRI